ncbi:hypothetical protein P9112_007235 [Eukaryota sp. TZLM1-RC]
MPSRHTKTAKGRLDKYYHLAKERGYRSRAAFKLQQINQRYDFLSSAKVVLDLCAAPGGWSQVAVQHCPVPSIIIAIDLDPIPPIKGVITLQEDITTQSCRASIKKHLKEWQVDVVVHDGAPNVGANWAKDAYNQSELTLHATRLATDFLRPGGTFVTKVFRSTDYTALLWVFNQLFGRVEAHKPPSSRSTSAEVFVVCRNFKAPSSIDPRMFDAKSVFADVDDKTDALVSLFGKSHGRKQRASRQGYEDEDAGKLPRSTRTPIEDFIWPVSGNGSEQSKAAAEAVLRSSCFTFDSELGDVIRSKIKEIYDPVRQDFLFEAVKDLKLLNQADLKVLMKFRKTFANKFKDLAPEDRKPMEITKEKEESDTDSSGTEAEEEELTFLEKQALAKEKKARKKMEKQKLKEAERRFYNMQEDMTVGAEAEDSELFSLSEIRKFDPQSDSELSVVDSEEDDDSDGFEYLRHLEAEADHHYESKLGKKPKIHSEEKKKLRREARQGFEEVEAGSKRRSNRDGEEELKGMGVDTDGDSDGDTSTEEEEEGIDAVDYDSDEAAEQLVLAKKMLLKSEREGLIDDGYNRYAFNDTDLPSWFVAEERKHMIKHKPVTKEEIQAMKEQLRDVDARPIKKVAEATARKKLALNRKLDKIKSKARQIAQDSNLTGAEKLKAITRSYRAVRGMVDKPERVYVVSRGFMQGTKHAGSVGKKSSRVRFVDSRMRADKRASESKKGSKGKTRYRKRR